MLAMHGDEAGVMVAALAAAVIALVSVVRAWGKAQSARFDVLRRALEHPAIDEQTKRELVSTLAHGGRRNWGKLVSAMAWVGLFVGIGCAVSGDRDAAEVGPILMLLSFGVLSVPLALRELEGRSKAAVAPRPPR